MTDFDIEAIGRLDAVQRVLDAVAHHTGMGFVALAHVTDTRWVACAVRDDIAFGLEPGGELPVQTTICNEIRQHRQPVVFGEAQAHPDWSMHATPRLYGFESYVSLPIFLRDGSFFGTLCALDPQPARLDDPNIVATLRLFAELIGEHLHTQFQLREASAALVDANDLAKWREQFIAMVGHDLRSPLQAVSLGVRVLDMQLAGTPHGPQIASMQRSCARMGELIDNLLDFTRGRLGGGIPVRMTAQPRLGDALAQVIEEVGAAHPGREIVADVRIAGPVVCDRERIAQLLTNLLVNAITHGAQDAPVHVTAHDGGGRFELSVANAGTVIPRERLARLFEPFRRGVAPAGGTGIAGDGLGLGLYIAHQITLSHDGELEVESSEESGTCFTLRMPAMPCPPRGNTTGAAHATH